MSGADVTGTTAGTFVIDLDRCTGCWACAVACRMRNELEEGEWWIRIETVGGVAPDTSSGSFPDVRKHYRPVIERCSETTVADEPRRIPPCAAACPTRAIELHEPGDPKPSSDPRGDRPAHYAGRTDDIAVWYRPARAPGDQRRSGSG